MVAPSRSGRLNLDVRRKAQQSIVVMVLRILHDAWPATIADAGVDRTTNEDTITNVLRWKMNDAKKQIDPVPQIRFEREAQSDDPELDTPIGLIDIKILYTMNDETYLTMECKRITSTENSLALKYVRNGVNRFTSGKYGPRHAFGIVTGYVTCGDPDACAERVGKTLAREPVPETGYDSEFGWRVDDELIKGTRHYRTQHSQTALTNTIELIHAFVSLN
ncbi:hypothetical protein KOR42_34190 [Thalassoglobus neptunius]|uniref:Uncharacterized protein n=1 Tax=Thalassoglobus neptunius TaxID=1938619 RepID=A0A5C5WPF8_9PLAN|nr:hypothetical protein [Thalassoglobus neptunius]TWT51732.1 hypothetical protein KOR42_34190 [Thalassoglobus neptunius]